MAVQKQPTECEKKYKNLYRKMTKNDDKYDQLISEKKVGELAEEFKATVDKDTATVYIEVDKKQVDTDDIIETCDNFRIKYFVRNIAQFMLDPQSSLNTARATAAANVQARTQQRVNELKKNAATRAVKYDQPINNHPIFSQTPLSANEAKQNAEALAYAASRGATPTEAVTAVNKANGETVANSKGNVWSAVLTEPDTYLVKLVEKGTRGQASEKSGGRKTRRSNSRNSRSRKSKNSRSNRK